MIQFLLFVVAITTPVDLESFCIEIADFFATLNAYRTWSDTYCTNTTFPTFFGVIYNDADYIIDFNTLVIPGTFDFAKIPYVDQLTYIRLNGNEITEVVNTTLAVNLRQLSVANNLCTSIPLLPQNLAVFEFDGNPVQNRSYLPELPPRLESLMIRYLSLNISLPHLPTSLRFVDIEYNTFYGLLPDLSTFSNLTNFKGYGNYLTGSLRLPESVLELRLSGNGLNGTLPILPHNLQTFIVNGNHFTGTLPKFPVSIQNIRLKNNRLEGNVNLTNPNLQIVILSGNLFSGTLLVDSLSLTHLDASDNYFENATIIASQSFFTPLDCVLTLNRIYLAEVSDPNIKSCDITFRNDTLPSNTFLSETILKNSFSTFSTVLNSSTQIESLASYNGDTLTAEVAASTYEVVLSISENTASSNYHESVSFGTNDLAPTATLSSENLLLSNFYSSESTDTNPITQTSFHEGLSNIVDVITNTNSLDSLTTVDSTSSYSSFTSSLENSYMSSIQNSSQLSSKMLIWQKANIITMESTIVSTRPIELADSSIEIKETAIVVTRFKQFTYSHEDLNVTESKSNEIIQVFANPPKNLPKNFVNNNLSDRFVILLNSEIDPSTIVGILIAGLALVTYIICLIERKKTLVKQFSLLLISFLFVGILISCLGLVFNIPGYFWARNICKETGMWLATLSFMSYYARIFFIVERPINSKLLTRFSNLAITWYITLLLVILPTLIVALTSIFTFDNQFVPVTFGCIRLLMLLRFTTSVFLEESKLLPFKPVLALLILSALDLVFTLPLEITSEVAFGLASMSALLGYLLVAFSLVGWKRKAMELQSTKLASQFTSVSKHLGPIFSWTKQPVTKSEIRSKQ
eukprot:NODE_35_length_36362_cov_0.944434.p1 type:complete len:862 gc:universal NODE_35_length_36362_cov_0.944434:23849-26434(+)